jgi:asparagine synthase (glutamine-hydrolysing)
MCGIAGIANINPGTAIMEAEIRAMLPALQHRGPDGSGVYLGSQVALGHTRLSIVDLAGGAQPLHNEDATIWVSFNGEIFNFIELRKELEAVGHKFSTHCDTEVIVHAYEQYGDRFVDYLNGQFAIALWDSTRQRLLLVRDRPGILPLFYTEFGGRLLFASEVKALLRAFDMAPRLDVHALDQLFTFWAPVSPKTLFEGVKELPPGHMLVLEQGVVNIHRYWEWDFPSNDQYLEGSESVLAEQLYELLKNATRLRLRADVPVGAYLSGGLDSSALVALIRQSSTAELKTFSIGFEDSDLDESYYQNLLIQHLNVDHHRTLCRNHDISRELFDTIYFTEMPILRTAPVPMRQLSELVRQQGYKVVLTGEGSDEVLGGYDIFKESKIRTFWAQQPHSQWRPLLLKILYPWIDTSKAQTTVYLRNFYGTGLTQPESPLFSHFPRWQTTAQCKVFFSDHVKTALCDRAEDILSANLPDMSRWHPFNRSQYIEVKTLMAGYLLNSQGDRMLMANSVEGRFPFLDHHVIEFANRLSPRLKMRVLREKYLLKCAMSPYLPSEIIDRYKQPYRAPDIPAFFSDNNTSDYLDEMLSEHKLRDYGYFDTGKVQLLIKKARAGRAIAYKDNMAFIGILSTQIWHYHFIESFRKINITTSAR